METCFLVCPIGDTNSPDRIRSDKLMRLILQPICNDLNIDLVRVDKINQGTKITDDIHQYLDQSKYCVVDITNLNPNVFYELGYRIRSNLPTIIIKSSNDKNTIPFDISGIRVFTYSFDVEDIEDSKSKIKEALINTPDRIVKESYHGLNTKLTTQEIGNGYIAFNVIDKWFYSFSYLSSHLITIVVSNSLLTTFSK